MACRRTTRYGVLGALTVVMLVGAAYGVRIATRGDAAVEPFRFRVEPLPDTTDAVLPDDVLFEMSEWCEDASRSYSLHVRKDGFARLDRPHDPSVALALTDEQMRECVHECLYRGLATMKPSSGELRYSPGTFYRLSLNAVTLRRSVGTVSGDEAGQPLRDLIEVLRRVTGVEEALTAKYPPPSDSRSVSEK